MALTKSIEVESFETGTEVFVADLHGLRAGVVTARTILDRGFGVTEMEVFYEIEPTDRKGDIRTAMRIHGLTVFGSEAEAQAAIDARKAL